MTSLCLYSVIVDTWRALSIPIFSPISLLPVLSEGTCISSNWYSNVVTYVRNCEEWSATFTYYRRCWNDFVLFNSCCRHCCSGFWKNSYSRCFFKYTRWHTRNSESFILWNIDEHRYVKVQWSTCTLRIQWLKHTSRPSWRSFSIDPLSCNIFILIEFSMLYYWNQLPC